MRPGVPPGPDVAADGLVGRRVVIVGAGVAGASLAWAAATAGAEVTLIDSGRVAAQGASSVPVALVNPHRGRTARASDADLRGAATLWRWADALHARGYAHGARRDGVVRVASDERQRRAWEGLDGVRHVGPGSLGPFRLRHGGFVVDSGGWLDPRAWLAAIVAAAVADGARVHEGERAERIEGVPGCLIVHTTLGATRSADVVALCIGASPPGSLPFVPVRRIAGEVVLTPFGGVPHALAGGVYAAPVDHGPTATGSGGGPHLAVGGNHREPAEAPIRTEDAESLLTSARWALPTLGDEIRAVWTGVRARGSDPEPIVRQVAANVWFVGAFAGRGFLRAAPIAEDLVQAWTGLPRPA